MTVKRFCHGWIALEKAYAYEELLREEIFPEIEAKQVPGWLRIELLRRELMMKSNSSPS